MGKCIARHLFSAYGGFLVLLLCNKHIFYRHLFMFTSWLRPRPHYSEEIGKRSLNISTVRRTVHTNTSRKRCVAKTLFKPEPNLKTPALRLRRGRGKHFENRAFRKRWRNDDHVSGDCCVFKFLRCSPGRRTFDAFRIKTPFLTFSS